MPTVSGVPIIGGITFNFNVGGYIPPSASGTIYNFQYSEYTLNQIWSDDDYIYAATSFGLDIIDKIEEDKIAYIHYNGGFNSVWANDDVVYLATSASGIKHFNKTCISGTVLIPENLVVCLSDYTSPFGITSQTIRYIHGSSDDYLMCCTNSGVDVYYLKPTIYRSSATISGAKKCFMTSTGKFYYTTITGVNRVDKPLWDWTTPDYEYYAGSGILASGIEVNDIFFHDLLFIATTSGVYEINEDTLDYNIYYTTSISGGILPGNDNNFKAVWADDYGIYIALTDMFCVIRNGNLVDYYTQTHAGRAGETLNQNDITDVT